MLHDTFSVIFKHRAHADENLFILLHFTRRQKKIFKWCCGEYFKSSFCYKTYFVRQIDRFDFYYGTEQKINRRFARIETIELPYKIRKQVMLRRMLYNDAPRHFMSWCIDTESGICSKKCTSQSRKKEGSRESVIFL